MYSSKTHVLHVCQSIVLQVCMKNYKSTHKIFQIAVSNISQLAPTNVEGSDPDLIRMLPGLIKSEVCAGPEEGKLSWSGH